MTDLTHIEELEKKATPGPWKCCDDPHEIDGNGKTVAGNYDYEEGGICSQEDRNFIVALRNAAPGMIEEIKRLRAEQEWQPIETAPRDGTRILAWFDHLPHPVISWFIRRGKKSGKWSSCGIGYSASFSLDVEPTHWKPLPPPPKV